MPLAQQRSDPCDEGARRETLALVERLSRPGAKQDSRCYVLRLAQLTRAAEIFHGATAELAETQRTVAELEANVRRLERRCDGYVRELEYLERPTAKRPSMADAELLAATHVGATVELRALQQRLANALRSRTRIGERLRHARSELERAPETLDIGDPRPCVAVGDPRIDHLHAVLLRADETQFDRLPHAESDRALREMAAELRASPSLFLDPTTVPEPTSTREMAALRREYRQRLHLDEVLARPVREKLQRCDGRRRWLLADGSVMTGRDFGPPIGLTDAQRRVMQEELQKFRERDTEASGPRPVPDERRVEPHDAREDRMVEERWNLLLGRIREEAEAEHRLSLIQRLLDHGYAVAELRSRLAALTSARIHGDHHSQLRAARERERQLARERDELAPLISVLGPEALSEELKELFRARSPLEPR